MKKTVYLTVALALLTACSGDNASRISPSTVKALVTESLKEDAEAEEFNVVKLGYYEENDEDARYTLRKLAAAGVITYEAERVETTRRIKGGYTVDYRTHRLVEAYRTIKGQVVFVHADLTDEGRKWVVAELPEPPVKEDKYLKPLDYVYYPEFDAPRKDVFPGEADEGTQASSAEEKASKPTEPAKSEPATDYEKAKAREKITTEFVKCYSVKVVDVRNIFVKDGKAKADFVLEAFDVSPFGRIYNQVYENTHTLGTATFTYYQDKKWVVDSVN